MKKVNFKGLNNNSYPRLCKQSSLDSKIENIFDEQEFVQQNANEVDINAFQTHPIALSNGYKDSNNSKYLNNDKD